MSEIGDLLAETAKSLAQVEEFSPRRFLRNAHLQTLVANYLPRRYVLPEAEAHIIEVDAGHGNAAGSRAFGASSSGGSRAEAENQTRERGASYVLCHCHWQPNPGERLTVVLLHGLEG